MQEQLYTVKFVGGKELEVKTDGPPPTEEAIRDYIKANPSVLKPRNLTEGLAEARAAQAAGMQMQGEFMGDVLAGGSRTLGRQALRGVDTVRGLFGYDPIKQNYPNVMAPETTGGGKAGEFLTEALEYIIPAGAAARGTAAVARLAPAAYRGLVTVGGGALAQGATAGGVAAGQGHDWKLPAALGAGGTLAVEGAIAAAPTVAKFGRQMVRSELQPTLASMKVQPGASWRGIDKVANDITDFIIKNRLMSPEAANKMVVAAEQEVQSIVQQATAKGVTVPAPQVTLLRLQRLRNMAAKASGKSDTVDQIDRAIADYMARSPLTEDVTQQVVQQTPLGTRMAGGPPTQTVTVTGRQPRTDVTPTEALEGARLDARFKTGGQHGEFKPATMEIEKAYEIGQRNALKGTLPDVRAPLKTEGNAIAARNMLERAEFRGNNLDPGLGPVDAMTAAIEVGTGHVPVISFTRALIRNNKLRLGIYADDMARALKNNDAQATARILQKLGVAIPSAGQAHTLQDYGITVKDLVGGSPQ
jgi:hypothetical protein